MANSAPGPEPDQPEGPVDSDVSALEAAKRHLGWDRVCERVRAALRSPVARALFDAAAIDLTSDEAEADRRMRELAGLECMQEVARTRGEALPAPALGRLDENLDPILEACARREVLDVVELRAVREVLAVAEVVHSCLESAREFAPGDRHSDLSALAEGLGPLPVQPAVASLLARSIEDGEDGPRIADSASPALASARKERRSSRQALKHRADRLVKDRSLADAMRDSFWTEREGRVVLPIRSDSLGSIRGDGALVHGTSASGHTFFVEPRTLVEANNELRRAEQREIEEEHRVRVMLTRAVAGCQSALGVLRHALVAFDYVQARLAVSEAYNGIAPEIESDEQPRRIELVGVRHPLMVLEGLVDEVVANDIAVELGHGLIISGPNAGGKTVSLKTLGLCALMTRAGLRLPVEAPSRLPLFDWIVTDVGDDQSIAANLSTFTAHVGHLAEALRCARRSQGSGSTLVLLDEVAVGTDPEQGAALAEAVLLALVDAGATVLATTHYDRLKLLATRRDPRDPAAGRFHNVAVGFDLERMAPTYTLTMGVPGSSSAIAVARRLGFDESVLVEAERTLGSAELEVDVLLRDIAQEREHLGRARAEVEETRTSLERREARLEAQERRLEAGARSKHVQAHDEAATELRAIERELKARRRELRRSGKDPEVLPTRGDLREDLGERLATLDPNAHPLAKRGDAAEVVVGDEVRVAGMDATGKVLSIKGTKVTVQLPKLRTTVTRDRLSRAEAAKTRPPRAKASKGTPLYEHAPSAPASAARHFGSDARPVSEGFDNHLDLRGQRVEDALGALEDFLARALARDRDVVIVRHGHGSGALRSAVRARLGELRHVRRQREGLMAEGGDSVTVAWVDPPR